MTASGVIGDATVANAVKGERLLALLAERLEALCRDLHATASPRYRERGSHCP